MGNAFPAHQAIVSDTKYHGKPLLFDFVQGKLLYLAGTAYVIGEGAEILAYEGAERLLRFQLEQGYQVEGSLPLRASLPHLSPFSVQTGSW